MLRYTYALLSMTLLSMTLLFSAAVAAVSVAPKLPAPGLVLNLVDSFSLRYAVNFADAGHPGESRARHDTHHSDRHGGDVAHWRARAARRGVAQPQPV